jgi:hypothetical protein
MPQSMQYKHAEIQWKAAWKAKFENYGTLPCYNTNCRANLWQRHTNCFSECIAQERDPAN